MLNFGFADIYKFSVIIFPVYFRFSLCTHYCRKGDIFGGYYITKRVSIRRVLVWHAVACQTRTRKTNKTGELFEANGEGLFALNRLAKQPLSHTVFCSSKKCCAFYFFIAFCVSLCINASSSSVPRISPSSYNVALSNRSNFCDHSPISVTTSSFAISAVMYDGNPRE